MGGTLGIFVGSASSFNLGRAASNIGQALSSEFTTHLIATDAGFAADVSATYDGVHGPLEPCSLRGEVSALRSYVQSHDPDALFQITSPPIHGNVVGSLGKIHGIPFVYRYSGDRFYEHEVSRGVTKLIHFGLNNVLGRFPLYLADAYVTLGPRGQRRLENRGVAPDEITIIPPVVDRDRFSTSTAEPDGGTPVGLFVGRLSRRKGIETLERTLPEILQRRSDIEFVLVGKQQESIEIPAEYSHRVTVAGTVPPTEIPAYYERADFLVHPTLTEGLPRVVLEALASDIPPIARDVGDIAYATENTFQTDREFIEMVCDFESLNVDSSDPFTLDTRRNEYVKLFEELLQ
jgi:glycosyltransferase involved in cell wall biosynthesis